MSNSKLHVNIDTNTSINRYYRKSDMTPKERYEGLANAFKTILDQCREDVSLYGDALQYWESRNREDAKLLRIQQWVVDNILRLFNSIQDYKDGFPIGSFTSKTHTHGSDLDFFVGVTNPAGVDKDDIPAVLRENGFEETETRNTHDPLQRHRVFSRMIDGVEIEMKIRYHDAYMEMICMHEYINKEMDIQDKIMFTYLKVLLQGRPEYHDLKMLYYCNAGHHAGVENLLYKLRE